MAIQHYINHISLVVDRSGSMTGQPVVRVFDKELEYLKQRSVELNQETRISIYLFDDKIEVLAFDMDVMRFKTLQGHYTNRGQTALMDAVYQSIREHRELPEIHGDHAFLQYVITDGQENASRNIYASDLNLEIKRLPENWTTAILVPDARGKFEAKKFGFEEESIAIWETAASNAFEKVGRQFSTTIDNYMSMRSSGIRGTKSLFTLDPTNIRKTDLVEVPATRYKIIPVHRETPIREWVETWTKEPYRLGSSYYQPTKPVEIQDYKNILVQDAKTGRVYEGQNLRQLLGLPHNTVKVAPAAHPDWRIFVQSTSVNRKLYPNTFVLVRG
jgi:hypothetical protein